jgi:ribosomal protein S18 acetylase RimI-like enzyme
MNPIGNIRGRETGRHTASGVEKVNDDDREALAYLETNLIHNALEIWSMKSESQRHELHVRRHNGAIIAHLGIYHAPEADYVSIGGQEEAIGELLSLIPEKGVVLLTPRAFELVRGRLKSEKAYMSDLMLVERGEERLVNPDRAVRLSEKDSEEYAALGPSFVGPPTPTEWARERILREAVFGVFEGRLVSTASVVVPLPEIAVVIGVETRKEFRRRGYGTAVVSAATREALDRSKSCLLGVASDNEEAKGIYHRLGFRKVGEEVWVDVGTGLSP